MLGAKKSTHSVNIRDQNSNLAKKKKYKENTTN